MVHPRLHAAIPRSWMYRLSVLTVLLGLAMVLNASRAEAKVVWLCQPGHRPDPCAEGLSTTFVSPSLQPYRTATPTASRHRVDCFYVYPTISPQQTTYSNLEIQPEQITVARLQVARLSQYCRVYAPMYHQITIKALLSGNQEDAADLRVPLASVRSAFNTYLAKYNHGRGFIVIGHSQGSFVLNLLLAGEVDRHPALRRHMLSAILLGGKTLVMRGSDVGGTFEHIPACRSAVSLSCVIGYSSFDATPPAGAFFGRSSDAREQVLCVNPAALIGARTIDPIFPTSSFGLGPLTTPLPSTRWTTEPNAYTARCEDDNGANVLEVHAINGAATPTPLPNADWGLHLIDANLEQGDLLTVIKDEIAAYAEQST